MRGGDGKTRGRKTMRDVGSEQAAFRTTSGYLPCFSPALLNASFIALVSPIQSLVASSVRDCSFRGGEEGDGENNRFKTK